MLRPLVLLAPLLSMLGLTGCGYTPQQLGITGPGTGHVPVVSHASEADEDALVPMPGLQTGSGSSPAEVVPPNFGAPAGLQGFSAGSFYGYN